MASRLSRIIKKIYFLVRSGGRIRIKGFPVFDRGSRISAIGHGSIYLNAPLTISYNSHLAVVDGIIEIADNVSINRNCIFASRERITIGEHCLFGPNVCIYDHDHIYDETGLHDGYKTAPVIIEKGCWIGAGTIILRGTHIGEGCVVGAGAIIKGEIPAHSLVINENKTIVRPMGNHITLK